MKHIPIQWMNIFYQFLQHFLTYQLAIDALFTFLKEPVQLQSGAGFAFQICSTGS